MKLVEIINRGQHDLRFEIPTTLELIVVAPGKSVQFKVTDDKARQFDYLKGLYASVRVKDITVPKKTILNEVKKVEQPKSIKPVVVVKPQETKPIIEEVKVQEAPKEEVKKPRKRRKVTL